LSQSIIVEGVRSGSLLRGMKSPDGERGMEMKRKENNV
jgi:hypothetical protein